MKKIEINFYRNKMIIAKKRSTDYKEIQNRLNALEKK